MSFSFDCKGGSQYKINYGWYVEIIAIACYFTCYTNRIRKYSNGLNVKKLLKMALTASDL